MAHRAPGEGTIVQRRDGRWQASLQVAGRRRAVYGRSRREAADKLRALQAQARATGAVPQPGRRTVGELLEAWLSTAPLRPRTLADYQALARRAILPTLGSVRLSRLTPDTLERLYGQLRRAGLRRAPSQVHSLLHRALNAAVAWGWLASNPADRAQRPAYHAPSPTLWSAEELRRFLAGTAGDRWGPLWVVLLGTGIRLGEALALTWDAIDLEAGRLEVRANLQRVRGEWVLQPPKTRAGRRVLPLPQAAIEALRRQRLAQAEARLRAGPAWQDRGLVFSNLAGGPLQASEAEHALARACRRLGVPRLTPHKLRHQAASLMLGSAVPLPMVSRWLGHASPHVTAAVYSHALAGQDRAAAEVLDRVLGGAR